MSCLRMFKEIHINRRTLNFNLFIKIYTYYSRKLEISIKKDIYSGILAYKKKKIYNYIILRSSPLEKILLHFFTRDIDSVGFDISLDLLMYFISSIEYIGKGCGQRRFQHLKDAKLYLQGCWKGKVSLKLKILAEHLKNHEGLLVIQLFADADNYMALCREHAMICTCLGFITNVRKGSPYGEMVLSWTDLETLNYGYMCLFLALRQCITERPNEIYLKHV